jgi:hypothetical protein
MFENNDELNFENMPKELLEIYFELMEQNIQNN